MRGRWVKPDEITDELLNELPIGARQLYIWLRNYADDQGVFADAPNEVHLAVFPGHAYPVEAWIDLLEAAGKLCRMVVANGRHRGKRVVFIRNFPRHAIIQHPSAPRWGYVTDCVEIPVPTNEHRLALIDRYKLPAAATDIEREFPQPVPVTCEHCDRPGELYRFDPLRGVNPEWEGTVAAARLEIVADPTAEDGVAVMCRRCRTNHVPFEIPAPDALFGGTELEEAAGTPTVDEAAADEAEQGAKIAVLQDRRRPRTTAASKQAAVPDEDVQKVFEAWKTETERTNRVVLDANREKAIRRALTLYSLDDILLVMEGWRHHPSYNGQRYGRKWNELNLLLRDARRIELFRECALAVREGRPIPESTIVATQRMAAVGDFTGLQSGLGEV